ncbi:MAG: gliding motility-associated C-terminal domain-containing protein, partial [Bacteroidia bacterium]|nr:gliding motility-associated C-terminal domain-containing protein [Bacteroidia bacterium]
ITSSDSCDNRKEYGNYKHQTIHLSVEIDTCNNSAKLKWTQYIGWLTEKHEIYRNTNNAGFILLNTITGSVLNYEDLNLPNNSSIQYFIRAYKNTLGTRASSSSNSNVAINSGKNQNPAKTKILQVTNNNSDNIEISIGKNPLSNYSSIDLFRVEPSGNSSLIYTLPENENSYIDLSANNQIQYGYYLMSRNVCGMITDTSETSNNIVLKTFETDIDYLLQWGRYFTWNTGVKEYIIYRATADNISNATNFVAIGTSSIDTNYVDSKTNNPATCYYVKASEEGSIGQSKSNTACFSIRGEIYYPNAIVIGGVNQTFTFIGYSIDLSKTNISIYNRWGQLEYATSNFENGWTGKNQNGNVVSPGVYFFIAEVNQGTEKHKINGNITVLE